MELAMNNKIKKILSSGLSRCTKYLTVPLEL